MSFGGEMKDFIGSLTAGMQVGQSMQATRESQANMDAQKQRLDMATKETAYEHSRDSHGDVVAANAANQAQSNADRLFEQAKTRDQNTADFRALTAKAQQEQARAATLRAQAAVITANKRGLGGAANQPLTEVQQRLMDAFPDYQTPGDTQPAQAIPDYGAPDYDPDTDPNANGAGYATGGLVQSQKQVIDQVKAKGLTSKKTGEKDTELVAMNKRERQALPTLLGTPEVINPKTDIPSFPPGGGQASHDHDAAGGAGGSTGGGSGGGPGNGGSTGSNTGPDGPSSPEGGGGSVTGHGNPANSHDAQGAMDRDRLDHSENVDSPSVEISRTANVDPDSPAPATAPGESLGINPGESIDHFSERAREMGLAPNGSQYSGMMDRVGAFIGGFMSPTFDTGNSTLDSIGNIATKAISTVSVVGTLAGIGLGLTHGLRAAGVPEHAPDPNGAGKGGKGDGGGGNVGSGTLGPLTGAVSTNSQNNGAGGAVMTTQPSAPESWNSNPQAVLMAEGGMVNAIPASTPAAPAQTDGQLERGAPTTPAQPLDNLGDALDRGLKYLQTTFGMNAGPTPASAIPGAGEAERQAGYKALMTGQGAATPEELDAIRKSLNPTNEIPSGAVLKVALLAADKHDPSGSVAASLIQSANLQTQDLGKQAIDAFQKQDYKKTADYLTAAYNSAPTDDYISVKLNHDGTGVMIQHDATGAVTGQHPMNVADLGRAAYGAATGAAYFQHLAQSATRARTNAPAPAVSKQALPTPTMPGQAPQAQAAPQAAPAGAAPTAIPAAQAPAPQAPAPQAPAPAPQAPAPQAPAPQAALPAQVTPPAPTAIPQAGAAPAQPDAMSDMTNRVLLDDQRAKRGPGAPATPDQALPTIGLKGNPTNITEGKDTNPGPTTPKAPDIQSVMSLQEFQQKYIHGVDPKALRKSDISAIQSYYNHYVTKTKADNQKAQSNYNDQMKLFQNDRTEYNKQMDKDFPTPTPAQLAQGDVDGGVETAFESFSKIPGVAKDLAGKDQQVQTIKDLTVPLQYMNKLMTPLAAISHIYDLTKVDPDKPNVVANFTAVHRPQGYVDVLIKGSPTPIRMDDNTFAQIATMRQANIDAAEAAIDDQRNTRQRDDKRVVDGRIASEAYDNNPQTPAAKRVAGLKKSGAYKNAIGNIPVSGHGSTGKRTAPASSGAPLAQYGSNDGQKPTAAPNAAATGHSTTRKRAPVQHGSGVKPAAAQDGSQFLPDWMKAGPATGHGSHKKPTPRREPAAFDSLADIEN